MTRFILFSLLFLTIFSCSKNDEDSRDDVTINNGSHAIPLRGIIDSDTGIRLKRMDNFAFEYDDNGEICKYSGNEMEHGTCEFDQHHQVITDNSRSYLDLIGTVSVDYIVTYNSKGYISSLRTPNGLDYVRSYSFQYDDNDHLININFLFNSDTRNFNIESDILLTWDRDMIISSFTTAKGLSNTDNIIAEEEMKYYYDNHASDTNINKYYQYAPSYSYISEVLIKGLFYLGLLGKGSYILPSSKEINIVMDENNQKIERKSVQFFDYKINPDGSLAKVISDNTIKNYKYDIVK